MTLGCASSRPSSRQGAQPGGVRFPPRPEGVEGGQELPILLPEALLPLGAPENLLVIAWGLSLEHPMMVRYGVNVLELVGHKVNL